MGEREGLLRAVAAGRVRRDPALGAWSPYWLDGRDVSAGLRALAGLALVRLPLLGPPELTSTGRLALPTSAPRSPREPVVEGAGVEAELRRWRVTYPVPAELGLPALHRHVEVVDAHLLQRHPNGTAELIGSVLIVGRPRLVPILRVDRAADIELLA